MESTTVSPDAPTPIAVGDVVDVVEFDIERGKVRELARAAFTEDSVHTDPAAAEARGYQNLPATPTHVVVSLHLRDQRAWVARLGLAIERVVVGSVRWTYHRPLLVGDRVTGVRRVVGDEVKNGRRGPMRLVSLRTDFLDVTGAIVVSQFDSIIERPAA